MSDKQTTLSILPAKTVSAILAELHSLRRRANAGENIPTVLITLHLRSGRDLRGWLIDLSEERGQLAALLQLPGNDLHNPQTDLLYLELSTIEAVTIHNAWEVANLISFGRIGAPPGVSPPTRLEVKRSLVELSHSLAQTIDISLSYQVDWNKIPQSGEPLRALAETVREATEVLKGIGQDPLGKEALAKRVKQVEFENGSTPGVSLKGDLLTITIVLEQGRTGRLAHTELRDRIEAVL
ncbi:MAG: hypothetical protein AB1489_21825 [Acidobacteriota bacterium]